jgi:hypothetical protein
VLAVAEPPRVVDFSYRLKQFELIDTVLDAISVTAKFDQPVFHNVSCANSNDQEKAVYAPCCAYRNVTGCVSSGDEIVPCVDFEHPSLNNTVGYKEWTYFYAHVDNYETCHSVVIENYAIGSKMRNDTHKPKMISKIIINIMVKYIAPVLSFAIICLSMKKILKFLF